MKNMKKVTLWTLGMVLAAMAFISPAKAATSQNVEINVTISGNKSVLIVGATFYDFGALNINTSSVSASAITVQNDSTVFIETYTITGANAISSTGGQDWTLQDATGTADEYALDAQFSDTRPGLADVNWVQDALNTSARNCSTTRFGNGTIGESGTTVGIGANRSLWFKMHTPSSVTDGTQHDVTLTVSVL